MKLQERAARSRADIAAQRRWISEHGGNLAGYVQRYGSADDADHYGDGGKAIYTADRNQLSQLESELAIIEGGTVKRAWIIDIDHDADADARPGTNANAVGVTGPSDADPEYLAVLESGKGRKFRMFDDDRNLVYEGRAVGPHWAENEGQWLPEEWAFGPLWDFGEGNYGCTAIFYRQNGNNTGPWQQL